MIALLILATGISACGNAPRVRSEAGPVAHFSWSISGAGAEFVRLQDAAVGPQGIIAVADVGIPQVFLLDSNGNHLASLGRRGEGPGEFMRPTRLGFIDDSLWVWDPRLDRITWFGLDGEVLRTQGFQTHYVEGTPWMHSGGEPLNDGGVLADVVALSQVAADTALPEPIVLVDSGGITRTIDVLDGVSPSVARLDMRHGGVAFTPQLFTARPIVATAAGGTWFFSLERGPARGSRADIDIVRYTPSGTEIDNISISYSPIRVGDDIQDSIRVLFENGTTESYRARLQFSDVLSALWIPSTFPPVTEVFADTMGFWFRRETFHSPSTWERYGLDGDLQTRIYLPGGVRGLAAAPNVIIGVAKDSLDIQYLQKYDLVAETADTP